MCPLRFYGGEAQSLIITGCHFISLLPLVQKALHCSSQKSFTGDPVGSENCYRFKAHCQQVSSHMWSCNARHGDSGGHVCRYTDVEFESKNNHSSICFLMFSILKKKQWMWELWRILPKSSSVKWWSLRTSGGGWRCNCNDTNAIVLSNTNRKEGKTLIKVTSILIYCKLVFIHVPWFIKCSCRASLALFAYDYCALLVRWCHFCIFFVH